MSATLQEIKNWLEEAHKQNATHLIVAVDRYDHDNYPVYVTPRENILKEIERVDNADMQGVDEVYNMSMNITQQLSEHRAFNT